MFAVRVVCAVVTVGTPLQCSLHFSLLNRCTHSGYTLAVVGIMFGLWRVNPIIPAPNSHIEVY